MQHFSWNLLSFPKNACTVPSMLIPRSHPFWLSWRYLKPGSCRFGIRRLFSRVFPFRYKCLLLLITFFAHFGSLFHMWVPPPFLPSYFLQRHLGFFFGSSFNSFLITLSFAFSFFCVRSFNSPFVFWTQPLQPEKVWSADTCFVHASLLPESTNLCMNV